VQIQKTQQYRSNPLISAEESVLAQSRAYFAVAMLTLLAACSDQQNGPTSPSTSDRLPGLDAGGGGNGKSSLDLIEEDYAAGLLDKNNVNRYREYAVSSPGKLPTKYRSAEKGKDATYSMVLMARDWDALSQATKQEILDLRANGLSQLKETLTTPHFVLHYTTQGNEAVPAQDNDRNGLSDYIDAAAESWETVWDREITQLGYPAPLGTPAQKFHVYYRDLRSYYGVTYVDNLVLQQTSPVPLGTATGYIIVENDFAEGFPPNDEDVTGNEVIRSGALKVTQAHEFMHAIQFNINVYQSGWLFESHATWAEDAVYDGINDWRWYINRFLINPELPVFNRYVYGSAFFMNYLSENYGVDVTRQIWLQARTASTPDAVRLAAFGGSWEPMKAFAPAEYLLDISDFTRDGSSVIPRPNRLFIRAQHASYPLNVTVPASTNQVANRAPWGLGANFIEFLPDGSGSLVVTFDGADGFAWRGFVIATPARGGSAASQTPVVLDSGSSGTVTVRDFGSRWSKVTLVATIADRPGSEVPYSYSASIQ
jgi:hypothetical protein